MILVRSPLRISFVGGGSDLPSHYNEYGGAVLSAAINKYVYVLAKSNVTMFPHTHRLVYSQVEEVTHPSLIRHPILKNLVNEWAPYNLDLDVMSDVPAGTGLGSSSAFTCAALKALVNPYVRMHNPYDLAEQACQIEIERLKEPIGKQDQYASAFGGINLINFEAGATSVEPLRLTPAEEAQLLRSIHLVYVGGTRYASALLKEQGERDNSGYLKQMAALAREAQSALRFGVVDALGPIIAKGWELKKCLSPNVSSPLVDEIISVALKNGATGGKLLGAGGCGFVLLFCPDFNDYREMRKALEYLDLAYMRFNFDFEGTKILYEG